MSLVRPSWQGPVDPSLVSPDWQWVYRNNKFLISADTMVERQIGKFPENAGGTRRHPGKYGTAHKIAASTDHVNWTHSDRYYLTEETWTLGWAVDITGTVGTASFLAHRQNGSLNGSWFVYEAATQLRFQFRTGGSNYTANFGNTSYPGTGFHTFLIVRRKGGNFDLFVDGLLKASATESQPIIGSNSHVLCLAQSGLNASNKVYGEYYSAFAVGDFAATVAQARQYHQDPFGFLRPASWGPELAAAGGTNATATPATIATTVALPAATTSTGSTVTPAATATTVALPAASVSTGATVTPATIAATVALPAATPVTAGNATVTPATIVSSVAVPTVSISIGALTTPSTIAATVALPAVSLVAEATVTPAAIAASVAFPLVADVGVIAPPADIDVDVSPPVTHWATRAPETHWATEGPRIT